MFFRKKKVEEEELHTYSLKAGNLFQELARVKCPSFTELVSTSFLVITFTVLFGLYFFAC